MRSNKAEYSTAPGMYWTMHDVKVTFYMTEFSSSKIFNHCLHVNNNKGESGIGYVIIIGASAVYQVVLNC